MSVLFSLRSDKYFGRAYPGQGFSSLFLIRCVNAASCFAEFLLEYWMTYFHEVLHVFLSEQGERGAYAEKGLEFFVARLLCDWPVDELRLSVEAFVDLHSLLGDGSWGFYQYAKHCCEVNRK